MEQEDQAQELEGAAADPAQDQGAETGTEEKDWKSLYEGAIKESRKWEKRSKASRAEIESLKAASPKQDPTLEERLAALEEENNSLKAAKARNALIDSGIIPAYAGNTSWRPSATSLRWDHPRVCGEHLNSRSTPLRQSGSSPRMRGTPSHFRMSISQERIIPAYAGNTLKNPSSESRNPIIELHFNQFAKKVKRCFTIRFRPMRCFVFKIQ